MATRTPDYIQESFNSFIPETLIEESGQKGDWLTVSTTTPGKHRFSNSHLPVPPEESYGDGTHVLIEGPGSVLFQLDEGVPFLGICYWSRHGSPTTLMVRLIGEDGRVFRETTIVARQKPTFSVWEGAAFLIHAVDVSIENATEHDRVPLDNFFTLEMNGKHAKALKQLKDTPEAKDAWLRSLRLDASR